MTSIDELVIKLRADISGLQSGLDRAKNEISNFGSQASSRLSALGDSMKNIGGAMTSAGMQIGLAVAPIAGALGLATKSAMEFEGQMNKLRVVGQGTAADMDIAKKTIIDLSNAYGETTENLTKTATDFAAVGYKMSDAIALTQQASLLAKAGLGSQEQATVLLAQALSQYNLKVTDASRLTDLFSYVANATSANVAGLSTSFGYVGTTANSLGISINETAAILGIIQNQLQDASMSGTGFREILSTLIDPPKEAAETIQALGIQLRDSTGALLPMGAIVDNVKNAMSGLSAAERDQSMSTIFGIRGMNAMNALMTAGSAEINKLTEGTNQLGYAQKTAAEMMKSPAEQWNQFQMQIKNTAMLIGSRLLPVFSELMNAVKDHLPQIKELAKSFVDGVIPAIRMVAGIIETLVNAFTALPAPVKNIIAAIAGIGVVIAAVAAPMLLFGGMLAGSIGSIISLVGMLGGASAVMSAVGSAIAFLTGPIGLTIMAVSALWLAWSNNWGGIREKTGEAVSWISDKFQAIKDTVSSAASWLKEKLDAIPTPLLFLLGPIGAVLAAFKHWEEIKNIVGSVVDSIKGFLGISKESEVRAGILAEKQRALADAEKELADAEKEYGDARAKLKDSTQKLAEAEAVLGDKRNNLKTATNELEQAEKGLADAKQKVLDLTRDISDAEDSLADSRLGVRDAALNLKEAEKDYAEILNKQGATADDVEKASIRLERAKLRTKSATEAVSDAEKKLEDTKASATGRGEAVLKAEDMKVAAIEKVKKAQKDLQSETVNQTPVIQKSTVQVEIDTKNVQAAAQKKTVIESGIAKLKTQIDTGDIEAEIQEKLKSIKASMPDISFESAKKSISEGWESIKAESASAYRSLKSTASVAYNGIISGVQQFAADHERELKIIGGGLLTIVTLGIWPLWKNNVGGIRDATNEAWESIKTKTTQLADWLAKTWEDIKAAAAQAWDALRNIVSEVWEVIKTTISDALTAIVNFFTPFYERLKQIGSTLFTKLKEGLELAYNTFVKPYIDIVTGAITSALDFGARAYNWGKNLISSFIRGITDVWTDLKKTAGGIAARIAHYIAIESPAKEGPLSGLMEWGPNLVKTFADGIRANIGEVNEAFALMQPEPLVSKVNIETEVEPLPKISVPDFEPPKIPTPSLQGVLNYALGKLPVVPQIKSNIQLTYSALKLPELEEVRQRVSISVEVATEELDKFMDEVLEKTVSLKYKLPELPKLENLKANITFGLDKLPALPKLEDLPAKINYAVNLPKIVVPGLSALLYLNPVMPQIPAITAGIINQESGKISETHQHTHYWNIRIDKIEDKTNADYLLDMLQKKIVKQTAVGVL